MSGNSFDALNSRSVSTASGAASGRGGGFKPRTKEETAARVKEMRAINMKLAQEAHLNANATAKAGKRPIPLYEADASRLVGTVGKESELIVKYNHGTPEAPDLHEECYILPLCHATRTTTMYGAGKYFVDEKNPNQTIGPDKWAYIMGAALGMPLPADIIKEIPEVESQAAKAEAFVAARGKQIWGTFPNTLPIFPELRGEEQKAVDDDRDYAEKNDRPYTEKDELNTKFKFWKKAIKCGIEEIFEKNAEGKNVKLFTEFFIKNNAFFKIREGRKEECSPEAIETLKTSTDARKREHAQAIVDFHKQGYTHKRIRVEDMDGKPIDRGLFALPFHDNALIFVCVTITWYTKGINRGCSMHALLVRLLRDAYTGWQHIDMNSATVAFAQKIKERSRLEVDLLRGIKACPVPDGIELVDLLMTLQKEVEGTKVTEAINSLVRDKMIKTDKTRTRFALEIPDLHIDSIPVVADGSEDPADWSKIVEEARARIDKKKKDEAEAAAKRKAEEEAAKAKADEEAKSKEAATAKAGDITAALTASASVAGGVTPISAKQIAKGMDGMRSMFGDDDDDDDGSHNTPAVEEPPVREPPQKKHRSK